MEYLDDTTIKHDHFLVNNLPVDSHKTFNITVAAERVSSV